MKLVRIAVQVQYGDAVQGILADLGVPAWTRHERIGGRDVDGRHDGSQAFPGSMTALVARVPDDEVGPLLDALEEFRGARATHRHLEAYVVAVERSLHPREDER